MPITVIHGDTRQDFDTASPDSAPAEKRSLARFLWLERRLPPRPLCNGIGRCGRCRVLFHEGTPEPVAAERRMLTESEINAGVRLACRHAPQDGMVLQVEHDNGKGEKKDAKPENLPAERVGLSAKRLRLAIDLGTTSVVWQAEDLAGNRMAAGQILNPQMCAGSDVMARLAEAATPEGAKLLHTVIGEFLRDTVEHLRDELGDDWTIEEIGLAANPAMTALALGLDASGLRAAPYTLPSALVPKEGEHGVLFGPEHFADIFFEPFGETKKYMVPSVPAIWTPPAVSPFVGGDVSAGLALLLADHGTRGVPFLLADMGTNGEFLLLQHADHDFPHGAAQHAVDDDVCPLLATSVPLGPALEGVGMSCGGMVGPGGVTSFWLGPEGLTPVTFDGGHPRHICGTGYLSLLRHLLALGVLDENGHFGTEESLPGGASKAGGSLEFLRKRLLATLTTVQSGERGLPLAGGLFLSGGDVERLLQVKAAFSLAVERLLAEAHLAPSSLKQVWLAGALGEHAPLDALVELGFLPAALLSKTTAVGNTSLRGVALLLRNVALRQRLAAALFPRRVLDLASDPGFHQDFIRHMRFRTE